MRRSKGSGAPPPAHREWARLLATGFLHGAFLAAAPSVHAQTPWEIDSERFRLQRVGPGYELRAVEGDRPAIPVPLEWLRPPTAVAAERDAYVSSFAWETRVNAFPIGVARLGLHLSSYTIEREGSAQAAAGRDLLLIHDPRSGGLWRGLDLGESKGRVRIGGCFAAWFHRILVGDADCDRRLDVAVVEERFDCEESSLAEPVWHVGPMRWFVQGDQHFSPDESRLGRLPCAGLRELPLIGLEMSPVEMLWKVRRSRPPLLPEARDERAPPGPAKGR